jgi:hypothetical protein
VWERSFEDQNLALEIKFQGWVWGFICNKQLGHLRKKLFLANAVSLLYVDARLISSFARRFV